MEPMKIFSPIQLSDCKIGWLDETMEIIRPASLKYSFDFKSEIESAYTDPTTITISETIYFKTIDANITDISYITIPVILSGLGKSYNNIINIPKDNNNGAFLKLETFTGLFSCTVYYTAYFQTVLSDQDQDQNRVKIVLKFRCQNANKLSPKITITIENNNNDDDLSTIYCTQKQLVPTYKDKLRDSFNIKCTTNCKILSNYLSLVSNELLINSNITINDYIKINSETCYIEQPITVTQLNANTIYTNKLTTKLIDTNELISDSISTLGNQFYVYSEEITGTLVLKIDGVSTIIIPESLGKKFIVGCISISDSEAYIGTIHIMGKMMGNSYILLQYKDYVDSAEVAWNMLDKSYTIQFRNPTTYVNKTSTTFKLKALIINTDEN